MKLVDIFFPIINKLPSLFETESDRRLKDVIALASDEKEYRRFLKVLNREQGV